MKRYLVSVQYAELNRPDGSTFGQVTMAEDPESAVRKLFASSQSAHAPSSMPDCTVQVTELPDFLPSVTLRLSVDVSVKVTAP